MFDQNCYEKMVYFSPKNNSFLGDEDPALYQNSYHFDVKKTTPGI